MELRILGCHGGESPKHKTSSFLIDGRVAIDAGAVTSMLTLEEQHRIETVLVSHAHLDHVRDLATLADNRCQQGGPTLRVGAMPETIAVLKAHFFNNLLWPDFTQIPAGTSGPTVVFEPIHPGQTSRLGDIEVTPVLVNHTIDTCALIVKTGAGTLAYSGDTGPTDAFYEVLDRTPDLRALLMEVSFPTPQQWLAKASGHHTPESLALDLAKMHEHRDLPILLYHMKPVFEQEIERELLAVKTRKFELAKLGATHRF